MIIGVPKEVKSDEYRVALLPVGAHLLRADGHEVLIQSSAGEGSGFGDAEYEACGAEIVPSAEELFARAELVVKVKEPQPGEFELLRPGQTLFTYFHLAADRELTRCVLDSHITAVAYETLRDRDGRLCLLTPMSEVAGKMSIQEGAKYLEKPMMGRGILLGGVAGVAPANVLVIGGGVVGTAAARVAAGVGAHVVLMDIDLERLRTLEQFMPANVDLVYSDPHAIEHYALQADLVVGAVLLAGDRAPVLLKRETIARMKSGAVVVDVAIDQGGCFETSRPTTHTEPTYIVDGVVHYCVANMPGAVGRTSTQALCNATLPYARELAELGPDAFADMDAGRASAVNARDGRLVNPVVAEVFPDLPSA